MVRINGKEYAWGDIKIIMWGAEVASATGIEYKLSKEKSPLYAAGRYAKGIQHGKRAAAGTLTILQSGIIAMNAAARAKGYKDILDPEVDIQVAYIPEDSTAITIDRIVCASFSEIPAGMKAGDMNSEHALPFVALDIDYDITNKSPRL